MEKEKRLKRLIFITVLFTLGMIFSDMFVSVFIWRLGSDFLLLCKYLFSTYAVVPFIFYAMGHLARRTDRVNIYKTGIVFFIIFYLTVLHLGEKVTDHLILAGTLKGLAMGFYWFGFHVLTIDYTDPSNRDRFYSYMSIMNGASSLIAPPLAGFIIVRFSEYTGYYTIFAMTAALFVAAVLLSTPLHSEPVKHPYRIKDLIFTKNKKWRGVLAQFFFLTAKDAIVMFLFAILIVKVTDSEFTLGKFSMLFSAIVIATGYAMSRLVKPGNRKKTIFIGCIIQFIAGMFIVWKISFVTLLINAFLSPIGDNMVRVPLNSYSLDVMGEDPEVDKRKMEYIVARDIPIAIGRFFTLTIFVLLLKFIPGVDTAIKSILFIVVLLPFGIWATMESSLPAHKPRIPIQNELPPETKLYQDEY